MQPVVTAAEMQALDRATIEELGIPAFTLMETAGRAIAEAARRLAPRGPIAVVCGPGNNGGDGYVAARVLRTRGIDATVYLVVPRARVGGHARAHLEVYERSGGLVRELATGEELDALAVELARATLTIDAIFGVGLARPVTGHLAAVIRLLNRGPVLAVDLPSGLDADTGAVLGEAITAVHTVTMATRKVALVSAPGFTRCGSIEVADLGIQPALVAATAHASLVEAADVARWLPASDALDHKGTRGHVLVIGGAITMRGAGRLSATAALRAGAGLVTLAGDGDVTAPDSIMTHALDADPATLAAALANKQAIVIGPGLGTSAQAAVRVSAVLASGIPCVIDADALNLYAGRAAALAPGGAAGRPTGATGSVVITPHPGEAARLLGYETAEVERDRLAAARDLAALTRAVVVLKGARTIVCDGTIGDDHCTINPTGGPALATGGSGDVLTGVIAALIAQGIPAAEAACAGVYLHGAAGDIVAQALGRGTSSLDLPLAIAEAMQALAAQRA